MLRSAACATVLALTALTAAPRAQLPPGSETTPGVAAAAALLRGDPDVARAAVAGVDDPARRARLQAALRGTDARPAAFLAVARAFPDHPDADLALVAGAAGCLVALGRGEAVPELEDLVELESDAGCDELAADDSATAAPQTIAAVVAGLWDAVRDRRARGGDPVLLAEAERLLRLASVTWHDFDLPRLRAGQPLGLPAPRTEAMLLHARRVPPGWIGFDGLDLGRDPDRTELLPIGDPRTACLALPPGTWLLELRAADAPWRAVRSVEVSDLDVLALVEDEQLAVWAARDGTSVATEVLVSSDGEVVGRADVDGVGVVAIPDRVLRQLTVRERGSPHAAWLWMPSGRQRAQVDARWRAHLMTDRPLYRPGETVRARLVVRAVTATGRGLDAEYDVEPAADLEVRVRATLGDGHDATATVRTDATGLAELAFPIPDSAEPGRLRIRAAVAGDDAADTVSLLDEEPCRIAAFERPAITVTAGGPATVTAQADAPVAITARALWASGGPAAGVQVTAEVEAWRGGWRREDRELVTDADGRVALPVDVTRLGPGAVDVVFLFAAPDGRDEVAAHRVEVVGAPAQDEQTTPRGLALRVDGEPVVGRRCRVTVTGEPGARVMLVVGRGRNARAELLDLDADGSAWTTVTPLRAAWPALDLAAATADDLATLRVPCALRAPTTPRVELPARVAPGAEVTCAVVTGQPATVVTLAIVDARIYTLAPDRTRDPSTALRPEPRRPDWRRIRTAAPSDPERLLAEMMVDGAVPRFDPGRGAHGNAGPGGPATRGPSGGASDAGLRTDFRATAVFETAVADAEGVARFGFRMPDDVTTWRATVVGVETDGAAFVVREEIATASPLVAEPRLPRVLRAGDAIDLPVVVDRGADASGGAAGVSLSVDGDGVDVPGGRVQVDLAPGRSAVATARLTAPRAGAATLSVAARAGELVDRSRRTVEVAADAVVRPRTTHAGGAGPLALRPHPDSAPDGGARLTVFGSDLAVLGMLRTELEEYPYGCVEQTLSGLLPFFATVRGARHHGADAPTMDAAFRARLLHGLKRLRALQEHHGGAFAWWPGQEPDLGMTALVVHGLCVARDGGLDAAAAGLRFDLADARVAGALARAGVASPRATADAVDTDDAVATAELAAACLRWDPDHADAGAAVRRVLAGLPDLPPGLAVRLGLALDRAGDPAAARRCLEHARTAAADASAGAFPGEAPVAVAALALELAFRLDAVDEAAVDALVARLCTRSASTYAQACAFAALTLCRAPVELAPLVVTVRAGDTRREVALDAEHGYTATVDLPYADLVDVIPARPARVRALLTTRSVERASDHGGWASPLRVERSLARRGDDGALVPVDGAAVRVGDRLTLRVLVTASEPVRYAVVECPLPAGLELPFEPAWLQRFDDRVAFTLPRLAPSRTVERRFEVLATLAGTTVWPPTVVGSMYAPGCDGGTAGGWLTVAAAPDAAPATDVVPCFSEPPADAPALAPPPEESPPTPLERALAAVDALWWDGWIGDGWTGRILGLRADPPRAQRDAVIAALDRLEATPQPSADDLDLVTALVEDLPRARAGAADARCRGAAWPAWRHELRARVDRLHRTWTDRLLQRIEAAPGTLDLGPAIAAAGDAVLCLPDRDAGERAMARLVAAAHAEGADALTALLGELDENARTPELRAALRACTGHPDMSVREYAVARLPAEDLAALPAAALVELQFGWLDPGIVTILASSAEGRAELRRRCADAEFLTDNVDALAEELPATRWGELPLDAFAALATAWSVDDAQRRLAASGIADATLREALARTADPELRAVCGEALRRRGARGPDRPAGGAAAHVAAWAAVLDAAADADVAALERVLDGEPDEALWADVDALREIAGRALAACAPPAVLARHAGTLPEDVWDAVFARLRGDGAAALLGAVTVELPVLPTARTDAARLTLWSYGLRCDDLAAAIDALARTEAGLAFARERVGALADGELRDAAARALDAAAAAWDGDAVARALQRLRFEPGPWPDAAGSLDRVLVLRGLR